MLNERLIKITVNHFDMVLYQTTKIMFPYESLEKVKELYSKIFSYAYSIPANDVTTNIIFK